MKKIQLIFGVGLLALCLSACHNQKKEPVKTSCLDLGNLDTTVSPKANFYEYANGGWMKSHPLTGEYSKYGSFNQLNELCEKQVQEIIDGLMKSEQKKGTNEQKISDLYKLAADTIRREKEGIEPLMQDIAVIKEVKTQKELVNFVHNQHQIGISSFFNILVAADEKNSAVNNVSLFQGGLGMPERDYYLLTDEKFTKIKSAYLTHIEKMFALVGFPEAEAKSNAQRVFDLETALAKACLPTEALRNPEKNYNKLSVQKLQQLAPAFDWNFYFTSIGLKNLDTVNVGQPEFFKKMNQVMASAKVEDLKAYYTWTLIRSASTFTNKAMLDENFDFYGKTLSGKKELQPVWKRNVNIVNAVMGEGMGKLYAEKYFPEESKKRMLDLVANLQEALKERIKGLEWMSDTTKGKAMEKLATFYVKIGYPNKWRDYSKLEIKADESYWANIKRSNIFDFNYMINKAGKPVDKDEWGMTPQTVNAYYNPTTNEICFPAGILQPPFFFANGDDALNYGAIGVVIGHEMTHGFDDQGRKYDKMGNMNDWWTATDGQNFDARAKKLADYFSQQIVLDSIHANGNLTLGENIADQGGLVLAYAALQKVMGNKAKEKLDGFTPEQRFYIAYANVWANNIRPEEILRLTKIDPHSLGRLRVNATLPHIQEFLTAFDIKEGDPMYLPKEKRAIVW